MVWSLIALCSISVYQETLSILKQRLFWSSNNTMRVEQAPFPHLRKELCLLCAKLFCYGREQCDVRVLQQNCHDFPNSHYNCNTLTRANITVTVEQQQNTANGSSLWKLLNISWHSLATVMRKVHIAITPAFQKSQFHISNWNKASDRTSTSLSPPPASPKRRPLSERHCSICEVWSNQSQ